MPMTVNNESSEIIRMFNTEFDEFVDDKYKGVTYYPDNLKDEIDSVNEWSALAIIPYIPPDLSDYYLC